MIEQVLYIQDYTRFVNFVYSTVRSLIVNQPSDLNRRCQSNWTRLKSVVHFEERKNRTTSKRKTSKVMGSLTDDFLQTAPPGKFIISCILEERFCPISLRNRFYQV